MNYSRKMYNLANPSQSKDLSVQMEVISSRRCAMNKSAGVLGSDMYLRSVFNGENEFLTH